MPKFLCSECTRNLEFAYNFKIQCEFTDRKLRAAIESIDGPKRIAAIEIDRPTSDNDCVEHEVELTDPNETYSEVFYLDECADDMTSSNGESAEMVADEVSLSADETEDADAVDEPSADDEMNDSTVSSTTSIKSDTGKRRLRARMKTYKCDTCHDTFDSQSMLRTHVKTHGKNRYACPMCGKWFQKRYHMVYHMQIHNSVKSFACQQCGKLYTTQTNLDRHVRVTHKNEKKHKCDECGKCFSQVSILRSHKAVHMSERKFPCDLCDKKFKLLEHLRSHKIRHLPRSEQPKRVYKATRKKYEPKLKTCICGVCGKKSTTAALHMSHMK